MRFRPALSSILLVSLLTACSGNSVTAVTPNQQSSESSRGAPSGLSYDVLHSFGGGYDGVTPSRR